MSLPTPAPPNVFVLPSMQRASFLSKVAASARIFMPRMVLNELVMSFLILTW